MKIDITQQPLNAESIEQKQAELSVELATLGLKRTRIRRRSLLVAIGTLVIAISVNISFDLLPWIFFAGYALMTLIVMTVGYFATEGANINRRISIMGFGTGTVIGVGVASFGFGVSVGFGVGISISVGAIAFILIYLIQSIEYKQTVLKKRLSGFDNT